MDDILVLVPYIDEYQDVQIVNIWASLKSYRCEFELDSRLIPIEKHFTSCDLSGV